MTILDIRIRTVNNECNILTPQQAYMELGLRYDTYVYILIDDDRLDKTYPFPLVNENGHYVDGTGPMFVVRNKKFKELKERYMKRRGK